MYKKVGCIKNLEVTSLCNLACPYCPAFGQGAYRPVGHMSEEVVDRSLYWLKRFVDQGTQKELNVFGVGEPLLHPKYVDIVRRCRKVMPAYLQLRLNTNGLLATKEIIRELILAGADAIDLTDHNAEASMKTIHIFRELQREFPKMKFGYSRDGVINPNNWGGLIDWIDWEPDHPKYICPWLDNGQVMIMSDGSVTRCCQDAHARGLLGTVWDDLLTMDHTPFVQCKTCHELVPKGCEYPKEEKSA
jgi:hypothetical protein